MSKEAYTAYGESTTVRSIDWSSDGYLRATVEEMTDPDVSPEKQKELSLILGEYLRVNKISYDPRVLIVDVVGKDGIVIASSRADRIGTDEGAEEREKQAARISDALSAKLGEAYMSTMVSEVDEDELHPMTHVTVRLFSTRQDENGQLIPLPAIVLVHFISDDITRGFLRGGAVHENHGHADAEVFSVRYDTGEIYLARAPGGLILTVPREGKEGIVLNAKVPANIARVCAEKREDFHGEYINYEGTLVIGAMECIEDGRTMLFAEVAAAEAFAPFYDMQRKIIFAILGVLLFTVFFSIFVSKSILRPLNEIVGVADRIAKNDFTARADVRERGEMGQLARVFNTMLDNITRYQKESEEKAKELNEKVVAMEKQNVFLKDVRKAMLNLLQDSWDLGASLKKEKEQSMSIITSMNEGLLVVNKKKEVILMNPTAEKLLEVKLADIAGVDPGTIFRTFQGDKELLGDDKLIPMTMKGGKSITVGIDDNFFVQTPSGKRFPVTVATTLLTSKDNEGVLLVFRDVTEEKALNDAKSNFISIASHQLRTPLTSIRWYSEVLNDGSMGPLNEMQADFMKEIYQGSLRLFRTIDTLLALSRVESGKFEENRAILDAKVFVEGTVKELEPLLHEKKITTHINPEDALPNIFVDAFMLKEVITNLVANSIRYTNEGGVIDIDLKKEDDHVLCIVRDNGIGIPEAQKAKIFERFFRADNAVSKVPDGSGLGLSLVKELVEKWGGKVWFESKEGEGTTFFVTIPAAKDASGA